MLMLMLMLRWGHFLWLLPGMRGAGAHFCRFVWLPGCVLTKQNIASSNPTFNGVFCKQDNHKLFTTHIGPNDFFFPLSWDECRWQRMTSWMNADDDVLMSHHCNADNMVNADEDVWRVGWMRRMFRSDPTITSGPSCLGDLSESLQPFGTGINCLRWGFLIIVRRRRSFRWQECASSHQLRSLKNYIADFKCAPIFWMIGWFLFQVNGIPLKGLYHEEVVGVLKEVSSQIFFLITVTLTKKKRSMA